MDVYSKPRLRAYRSGVRLRAGIRVFFLSETSRPTLGSTQPRMRWVPVIPSPKVKAPGLEVNHSTRSTPMVELYTPHDVSTSDFFSLPL